MYNKSPSTASLSSRRHSPKRDVVPIGFEDLVAQGRKIKEKTRRMYDEMIQKPIFTSEDVQYDELIDNFHDDDFYKMNVSKVPTQNEIDRYVI